MPFFSRSVTPTLALPRGRGREIFCCLIRIFRVHPRPIQMKFSLMNLRSVDRERQLLLAE